MPHGDASDYSAFFCFAAGATSIFAPSAWTSDIGPVKPFFDGPASPQTLAAIRFAGGLLMFMGCVLFVVRWNTINGKAGALGCLITSVNSALIALGTDNYTFKLRGWWLFTVAFFLAAMHLAFNANAMWTSETLAKKEAERAARKAKKK